jgi:hypothetical protein
MALPRGNENGGGAMKSVSKASYGVSAVWRPLANHMAAGDDNGYRLSI